MLLQLPQFHWQQYYNVITIALNRFTIVLRLSQYYHNNPWFIDNYITIVLPLSLRFCFHFITMSLYLMTTLSLNVVALYTWFLGLMPYGCDNIGSYHSITWTVLHKRTVSKRSSTIGTERGGERGEGGESATAPQEGALCCYILRQRHGLWWDLEESLRRGNRKTSWRGEWETRACGSPRGVDDRHTGDLRIILCEMENGPHVKHDLKAVNK